MTKKIVNLRITKTRHATIEVQSRRLSFYCRRCARAVEVLTARQAAALLEIDAEQIASLIAQGQLHTLPTVAGGLLICKDSLLIEQ